MPMPFHRFLDRDRTVAPPGFNRWLIPPAALAVHLCIGEIYGFSVFNGPLTKVIGISKSVKGEDWTIPQVGWIFSIALIISRMPKESITPFSKKSKSSVRLSGTSPIAPIG